ncbi:enoyl-CoA hydratase/isomerase family protein [Pedobacter nanyangensis]|uniref:enoyl-CoA hydratase/isomerase family protein n=1 Tax=Pedobacter nanyangensis TaxID=1562389 RepID=UPI000DE2157A|nr:enoyl-CoA hydratase-related protein [Pedobacter nanyangensis]
MDYQQLIVETNNNILYITINRPQKLNALNKEVLAELSTAVANAQNNQEVKAILITGAGEKAFVAGADIAEFQNYTLEEGKLLAKNGQETVFNAIENSAKPVIAAINGFALGGGLELAMACHLRIASENAKLGLPEVTLGLIPGYGGTQRLAQLVGKGKAFELIFTADMIPAQEALQLGLVNHVVPLGNLLEKANEILGKINLRAPLALASAVKAVNAGFNSQLNGYDVEIAEFGNCFDTQDFKEGVSAFLDKRKANFKGK